MIRRTLPLLLLPALFACEPSREQYRDDLAVSLCERQDRCNGLSNYGGDFNECMIDARATANDNLPVNECSAGQINDANIEVCQQEIASWDCDGLGALGDAVDVANKCAASRLCSDPPD